MIPKNERWKAVAIAVLIVAAAIMICASSASSGP